MVVLFPLQLSAQISTVKAEKYQHWMVVKTMDCNFKPPGTKGSAQTWDFTTLTPKAAGDTNKLKYMPRPSTLPFPNASMVMKDGTNYTFYEHKTDGVYELGTFDSSSLDTLVYTNTRRIMKHPITYLEKYTDSFSLVDGADSAKGIITDTVESFGVLKLPNATYNNVIRMRFFDSMDGVISGNPVTITRISYRWYDKDHSTALLTIDSIDIGGLASRETVYLLKEDPVLISDVDITPLQITAVFSGNNLLLTTGTAEGVRYDMALYNLFGQKIYTTTFNGGGRQLFNTGTEVAAGIYVLTVNEHDNHTKAGILKLVKQ